MSTTPKNKVQDYFYFLLSRRDYSTATLIEKALQKGYDGIDTKVAIKELTESGILNDTRYAENIIITYIGTKGKTWIKQKLMLKKIPYTTIEILLEETENINKANDSLKKKVMNKYAITDWAQIDIKTKQKLLNYLARQGFSNPFELLNSWTNEI
jgi:SOS response regulatory protein OraA/RecX